MTRTMVANVPGARLREAERELALLRGEDAVTAYITTHRTETDVLQKVLDQKVDWNQPIADFMQIAPSIFLSMSDSVGKAVDLMGDKHIYHIPLVNEKKELVNVLSVRTLIRFLSEFYPTEIYNLPPDPAQVMKTAEGG